MKIYSKQGFKFLLKIVNEKLLEKILRQKQTKSKNRLIEQHMPRNYQMKAAIVEAITDKIECKLINSNRNSH